MGASQRLNLSYSSRALSTDSTLITAVYAARGLDKVREFRNPLRDAQFVCLNTIS